MRYCRTWDRAAESSHTLVMMLTDLNASTNLPLIEYIRQVETRIERVYRVHGVVTPLSRGKLRTQKTFYGPSIPEVLLGLNDGVDVLTVADHWKKLQPLKVLYHPRTDVSWDLPYDQISEHDTGIAVISLDLIQMAVQYYFWVQAQKARNVEFLQTPRQFVLQYPIPNMLPSHVNCALFNRAMGRMLGESVEDHRNPWPFYMNGFQKGIDDYLLNQVTLIIRKPLTYSETLDHFQLHTDGTFEEWSRLPSIMINRQTEWALTLARLPVLRFVVRADYITGSVRNITDVRRIRRRFRELSLARDFQAALPRPWSTHTLAYIKDEIVNYL